VCPVWRGEQGRGDVLRTLRKLALPHPGTWDQETELDPDVEDDT
jgi:hypothetical protein